MDYRSDRQASRRRRSKSLRNNSFDNEYIRNAIYVDDDGISHSLNRKGNWKLLDDESIKKVKYHTDNIVTKPLSITNHKSHFYGGGIPSKTIVGKKYISIDDRRVQDVDLEGNYIIIPFDKDEYPIKAETHTFIDKPCPCCFYNDGRIWMLKGTGMKSKKKNKGMKKTRKRDLDIMIS